MNEQEQFYQSQLLRQLKSIKKEFLNDMQKQRLQKLIEECEALQTTSGDNKDN